jgi:hypothetical protein
MNGLRGACWRSASLNPLAQESFRWQDTACGTRYPAQ